MRATAIAALTRQAIRGQIGTRSDGSTAQRHAVQAAIKELAGDDDASAV